MHWCQCSSEYCLLQKMSGWQQETAWIDWGECLTSFLNKTPILFVLCYLWTSIGLYSLAINLTQTLYIFYSFYSTSMSFCFIHVHAFECIHICQQLVHRNHISQWQKVHYFELGRVLMSTIFPTCINEWYLNIGMEWYSSTSYRSNFNVQQITFDHRIKTWHQYTPSITISEYSQQVKVISAASIYATCTCINYRSDVMLWLGESSTQSQLLLCCGISMLCKWLCTLLHSYEKGSTCWP